MTKTRTFVDADVLINAFRGIGPTASAAQAVIDDPDREFVVSDILRLELLPKPQCFARTAEEQLYEAFFVAAIECVETASAIVQAAESEARPSASLPSALHVAAAKEAGVQDFITAEKVTSPLFRVTGLSIHSIRS